MTECSNENPNNVQNMQAAVLTGGCQKGEEEEEEGEEGPSGVAAIGPHIGPNLGPSMGPSMGP